MKIQDHDSILNITSPKGPQQSKWPLLDTGMLDSRSAPTKFVQCRAHVPELSQ